MKRAWPAIAKAALYGGIAAGPPDILVAAAINRVPPLLILKAVASGLLGASAYRPGASAVLTGLLLQILMSVVIAGIYAFAAFRIGFLRYRPLLGGLLYGTGVFVVMNLVVVPLSAMTPRPAVTPLLVVLNLLAMFVFGVIVSLIAARLVRRALDHPQSG